MKSIKLFFSNFTYSPDASYGNCFTFNGDKKNLIQSYRAGKAYGIFENIIKNNDFFLFLGQFLSLRMILYAIFRLENVIACGSKRIFGFYE